MLFKVFSLRSQILYYKVGTVLSHLGYFEPRPTPPQAQTPAGWQLQKIQWHFYMTEGVFVQTVEYNEPSQLNNLQHIERSCLLILTEILAAESGDDLCSYPWSGHIEAIIKCVGSLRALWGEESFTPVKLERALFDNERLSNDLQARLQDE